MIGKKVTILTAEEQIKIDRADEKELTRLQGNYRNYANNKFAVREDKNQKKNLLKNLEQIKREKRDVRTQLSVATGSVHCVETENQMATIELHVNAQEFIQKEIDEIQIQVSHIRMQLKRLDATRFALSKTATTDLQFQTNVVRLRKYREMLENRLDVMKKQECAQVAQNSKLQAYIDHMLYDRALFNKLWQKMILQLSFDKKFLIDMVDRAVLAFNQGADLCNQIDVLNEKSDRDKKMHITEMLDMIRKLDADAKQSTFLRVKGQERPLNDLEPREYKRRDMFREEQSTRTKYYKRIIEKVVQFLGVDDIKSAIETFNKSDNEYFGHFNYMNNLNHQVEFLSECLQRIYTNIDGLREYNHNKELLQSQTIETLNAELKAKKDRTSEIENENKRSADRLVTYLKTINSLFGTLKCDRSSLDIILCDQTNTTTHNVNLYLSILESRLNEVLNYVFFAERSPDKKAPPKIKSVRSAAREHTNPTALTDIVLVQQCAECAEGEVNRYDEEIVYPMAKNEVLAKVRVKTEAPEIQYRLHNLSKCRLPRSRMLANKRYQ